MFNRYLSQSIGMTKVHHVKTRKQITIAFIIQIILLLHKIMPCKLYNMANVSVHCTEGMADELI